MPDQPSDEAVEAAAWVLAGADQHADIGTAWIDCARRALAAAYPLLRQQIETEVWSVARAAVERQTDLADLVHFDRPSDFRKGVLTSLVALDAARQEAARGAAQPGGEQ